MHKYKFALAYRRVYARYSVCYCREEPATIPATTVMMKLPLEANRQLATHVLDHLTFNDVTSKTAWHGCFMVYLRGLSDDDV